MIEAGGDDGRWLDSAVRQAFPHLGTTGGHPVIAALIVDASGAVRARAVADPAAPQSPSISALREAGLAAEGATLYVTMEPSEDDALTIAVSGLARVVIGILDPVPEQRGRGLAILEQSEVDAVVLDHGSCAQLHAAYSHRIRKKRPLTTLRLAVSRDGMIGMKDGTPVDLLSEDSHRWLGLQRAISDAVMIGAHTAELDDPALTPGLEGMEDRPYARVLAMGTRKLPPGLQLFRGGHTVWVLSEPGKDFGFPPSVGFITSSGRNGRPDLRKSMAALAARNLSSLFVEGGAKLTEAMIAAELVDRFQLIQTEIEIGRAGLPATGLGDIQGRLRAAGFVEIESHPLGPDTLHTYDLQL